MTLLIKVLEIYKKNYVCSKCLGRLFSLLGTNTTNLERGTSLLLTLTMEAHADYLSGEKEREQGALERLKLLAENANYISAQKVMDMEGLQYNKPEVDYSCSLCHDILNNLDKYVDHALEIRKEYEINSFLVGASPDSDIINQEDILKSELNLLEAESFKSHFNREVGKIISQKLGIPPNFTNPDIIFIYNLGFETFSINLNIKSLFIYGRYKKLLRGIPQTKWICKNCQGKGCELCQFTGKQYETSVEELISPDFLEATKSSDSKFHGAGREDIDVRMIGTGRPFILELKRPKIRSVNLDELEVKINQKNIKKVQIGDLRITNKSEVIKIKKESEETRKCYKAIIKTYNSLKFKDFEEILTTLKHTLENQTISQRTPIRVVHRRADKIREKKIFKIEGKYIESNLFEFIIESQGGTYIKELISGDEGRTKPSFAEIFTFPVDCIELDVIEIFY